jgi:CheY-like chemotaxis protein
MGSVTVLVADDDDDVRTLVGTLIRRSGNGLRVVGAARDGEQALELFTQLHPDVVVLDYQMPGMDGLTCARAILEVAPEQKLLMFSAFLDESVREQAAGLGVPCLEKTRIRELCDLLEALVAT